MAKAKKFIAVTQCGDWHLGWGYGGHDKIGKLRRTDIGDIFEWTGHSQGRHGRTWNHDAYAKIQWDGKEMKILDSRGGIPVSKEIIKSLRELTD